VDIYGDKALGLMSVIVKNVEDILFILGSDGLYVLMCLKTVNESIGARTDTSLAFCCDMLNR